ncbi:17575_t:CDS:10, partial [Acaulospora morrowiae]
FKSYFEWASERDIVPSLSEFVQLNIDFIAKSTPKSNDSRALTRHSYQVIALIAGYALTVVVRYIAHTQRCTSLILNTAHFLTPNIANIVPPALISVIKDKADWSCVTEKRHRIKISEIRREKTYTMYSNENKRVGNELLEDQKESALDTNNSADAKTTCITQLTKRLLDVAEESPQKRLAKVRTMDSNPLSIYDSNDPFIVSETLDENELIVSETSDDNNSDESYRPSSDEPDDNSFIEIKRGKIDHTYDWFTGPGVKKSALNKDAKKWVIDKLDVSSLLLEYRDMSVQKASENKIEEVDEILSLNYIFLFEQNVSSGVSSMIEPESLNIIFDTIKNEFAPYHLSHDDVLRCHKMANTASEDFGKCKPLLRKWQKDLDDNQEDLILETFESIVNNFKSEVYRQGLKEDSFVHEVFEPVIRPFFRNINFKCEWSTDLLEASVHRKRKFDPILQGRKVDFSVYMPIRGNKFYLLTSEIKSADFILSSKDKISLEDCDFVKLGNEMKDIIDKCIDDGEPSPTKDISPLIESYSDEEKGITPNPLPEIEYKEH